MDRVVPSTVGSRPRIAVRMPSETRFGLLRSLRLSPTVGRAEEPIKLQDGPRNDMWDVSEW